MGQCMSDESHSNTSREPMGDRRFTAAPSNGFATLPQAIETTDTDYKSGAEIGHNSTEQPTTQIQQQQQPPTTTASGGEQTAPNVESSVGADDNNNIRKPMAARSQSEHISRVNRSPTAYSKEDVLEDVQLLRKRHASQPAPQAQKELTAEERAAMGYVNGSVIFAQANGEVPSARIGEYENVPVPERKREEKPIYIPREELTAQPQSLYPVVEIGGPDAARPVILNG